MRLSICNIAGIHRILLVLSIKLSICNSFSITSSSVQIGCHVRSSFSSMDYNNKLHVVYSADNDNNDNVNIIDYEVPKYPKPRQLGVDQAILLGDLSGGRPGSIVETEEQLAIKEQMFNEIDNNIRIYPNEIMKDYGSLIDDEEAEYIYEGSVTGEDDDENNMFLDAETLGSWTIQDLKSKFPYEWDPNSDEPDPNVVELNIIGKQYVKQNPMDIEDNVEIGYDPIFGPSNPIDTRTILGAIDSYVIDPLTRDEQRLTPQFHSNDIEINMNDNIIQFRKSLDIMETYDDLFLSRDDSTNMPVPRHVAKWHGYPEQTFLEPKNFTNNRFTTDEDRTNFDTLTPHRARERAVELARSKNAEWLPDGISQQYHYNQRNPYNLYHTLIGTVREGYSNPHIVTMIQPVLQILGSCFELLSIHEVNNNDDENNDIIGSDDGSNEQTIKNSKKSITNENQQKKMKHQEDDDDDLYIFRFYYHGLMKNKHGMKCYTEHMIQECFNNNNKQNTGSSSQQQQKKLDNNNDALVSASSSASSSLTSSTTAHRPKNTIISVVFETGYRRRDSAYDGGDPYYGPSF